MSDAPRETRSFQVIEISDLDRLAELALTKLDQAFDLGSASDRGVYDFDLWALYRRQPNLTFWNRKPSLADFGLSKFGRSPLDSEKYSGRRVDVFWRAIWAEPGETALCTVRRYFEYPMSKSAFELRKKSVVQIWPQQSAGEPIWDPIHLVA